MNEYDPFARGRFPVGVRTVHAADAHRNRQFACEIWYPAAAQYAGQDLAPATQDIFTLPPHHEARAQTAIRDAAAEPGLYPLIMYSHPSGASRRAATFLCTHLSSHGYVVAALDHSEVVAVDLARRDEETGEQKAARRDAVIASRVPDVRFLLDQMLTASWGDLELDPARIGIVGHSFGGWTALAATEADPRIHAVVALAPGGASQPRPGILPLTLAFRWGRDVPTLYLVAEGDTALPLSGMYELFERTPATKKMVILCRADHAHFMDQVEQLHELFRTMPDAGDLAAIQKEMRPMAELCSEEQAHLFVRGLTLCHMDAILGRQEEAHALLNGNIDAELARRGVGAWSPHSWAQSARRARVTRRSTITQGNTIMNDLQKQVQEAIDRLVESGTETGVQVAVYRHGETVVDAVAGVADVATGRRVTSDTPFFSASTGKGMTSTVVHVLVERGVFGYNTPIVELWPEFGAHGKQAATVRHVLTHTVGVPGVPADTTPEDLCDWDKMCARIADAEPWWEPGTKTGYHALTFGYIVGEIVRRATGKRISQVLREDVAAPLGVADELFFGVPASDLGRLARLEEGGAPMDAAQVKKLEEMMPLLFKAAPLAVQPSAALYNRADLLTSDIPAVGTVSARAVAHLYAALLGEVDGVRLIAPERLRELSAVAVDDVDQVFGNPCKMALGYAIGRPMVDVQSTVTVFGWSGAGGSHASADTATGTAFALTKNLFTTDFSTVAHVAEIVTKALADS